MPELNKLDLLGTASQSIVEVKGLGTHAKNRIILEVTGRYDVINRDYNSLFASSGVYRQRSHFGVEILRYCHLSRC